jgi:hypothetical protein
MRFRVTYADGRTEEVEAIPSARRALEASTGKTLVDNISSGFSDWADLLVHETLRIRHGETRPLEQWLETVDRLELQREEPVDPTGGEELTPDD